jgi:hypothetical protein
MDFHDASTENEIYSFMYAHMSVQAHSRRTTITQKKNMLYILQSSSYGKYSPRYGIRFRSLVDDFYYEK